MCIHQGHSEHQIERVNMYCNEPSGGSNVPRAILINLEPALWILSTLQISKLCEDSRHDEYLTAVALAHGERHGGGAV